MKRWPWRCAAGIAMLAALLLGWVLGGALTGPGAPVGAAPARDGGTWPPGMTGAPVFATDSPRVHPKIASGGRRVVANYAPSALAEADGYRMWWCARPKGARAAGEDIRVGHADSLAGPFTVRRGQRQVALERARGFDAGRVCDPSVLHEGGRYLMYYSGSAADRARGNAIGLARSTDGVHWSRVGGGPVVRAAGEHPRGDAYGAGRPSALLLDGWYYLMFSDTSAAGAADSGAGQFVLRSTDPAFRTGVQSLGRNGFAPAGDTATRERSILDVYDADWMWVDALQAFAVASQSAKGTTVVFWDRSFTGHPYPPVVLAGRAQGGQGLVRTGDGHAPHSALAPCSRVPLDVLRATVNPTAPTDLAHFGLDLTGVAGCRTRPAALSMLDGYGIPADQGVDLLVQGSVLRIQRREVADALAIRVLAEPVPVIGDRAGATLAEGVPALRDPSGRVGLLLDDGRLWPVPSARIAELNSSTITPVSQEEWDTRPRGADLSGLPGGSPR